MSTQATATTQAAVAPAITRSPENVLQRTCACGQHTTAGGECEECKKKGMLLQRHGSGFAPAVAPPIVHDVLRSPGELLDRETREFFESRFGRDLSHVRVHSDQRAAESAKAVSAHAYTVGRHVAFGEGKYAWRTGEGLAMLGHELTHVMQQPSVDGVPRYLPVGLEGDSYERQADSFARSISRGAAISEKPLSTHKEGVQRIGFGHQILRLFGFESGSFSDDDLTEYLDRLAKYKKCDCGFFDFLSDDKARQLANQGGVGNYKLSQAYKGLSSAEVKRILIQEMLSGATGDSDEKAIIKILQDSDGDEIMEILDPAKGLSMQDLDDDIGGDNHDRLVQLLEEKLPQVGSQHLKRSATPGTKSGACTADRAIKLQHAQKRAEEVVRRSIDQLDKYLQKPKEYAHVERVLQCYFTGADVKRAQAIRQDFDSIATVLTRIQYVCPAEPFTQFKVTDSRGNITVYTCEDDTQARALVTATANPSPSVLFCPEYFSLPPKIQASIVIHEAAHHVRPDIVDLGYGPKCGGLPIDTAVKNADSFAYFAMALEQEGLSFDLDDCPQAWKDKIVAAAQTGQLWVNTAIAKVDSAFANPVSPHPHVAKQLQNHFKIDATQKEQLLEVRKGLLTIQSAFGGKLPITCEIKDPDPQDENVAGKVYMWPLIGGGLSDIHLYRHWFEKLDAEEQAETIVHEMAHKYARKEDLATWKGEHNKYRALSTADLLDNADSYAQFSRYVQ